MRKINFNILPTFILLFFGSGIFFFAGCEKNCYDSDFHQYHFLSEEDKALIPYTGKEKLKFLHIIGSDTDTIVLGGRGKEQRFYEEADPSGITCIHWLYYENLNWRYEGDGNVLNLTVFYKGELPGINKYGSYYFSQELFIEFNTRKTSIYLSDINNQNLDSISTDPKQKFYDSLIISQKLYKNVSFFSRSIFPDSNIVETYVNKSAGIIKLKYKNYQEQFILEQIIK